MVVPQARDGVAPNGTMIVAQVPEGASPNGFPTAASAPFAPIAPIAGASRPAIPPTMIRDAAAPVTEPRPLPHVDASQAPITAPPVVPAPPPAKSRAGLSLMIIGVVSTIAIGGIVTAIVLTMRASSDDDDAPVPTIAAPKPAAVAADPAQTAAPADGRGRRGGKTQRGPSGPRPAPPPPAMR